MLRNCLIFRVCTQKDSLPRAGELRTVKRLRDCEKHSSGLVRRKIQGLMDVVRGESYSLESTHKRFYDFTYSAQIRAPSVMAIGDEPMPFVDVNFRAWLMKQSPFFVVFDAGRKLSQMAAYMLSTDLYEDPSLIEWVKLDKPDFMRIMDIILSDSHPTPGSMRRTSCRAAEVSGQHFKQITLVGDGLEDSDLFKTLRGSSEIITEIGFISPLLRGLERQLSCRLTRTGSLTLYTPAILDSEIARLLALLEPGLGS